MYICNPVILLPHLPIPPRIKPTKKPPNAQGSTKQKKSDSVSILLFPNKKARRSEPIAVDTRHRRYLSAEAGAEVEAEVEVDNTFLFSLFPSTVCP